MSVSLSITVLWLQARLGRGEFNSETTRVLHFVRNPEAEAQRQIAEARISELDAENKVRYPLHTTMWSRFAFDTCDPVQSQVLVGKLECL